MERFDVIVVGAGPAGATTAYLLAKAGVNVVLIERGQTAGSKNVSGGLLYTPQLDAVIPAFWDSAPLERAITSHQVVMLSESASIALDVRALDSGRPPSDAFSVLRARFDPWLAQQADEAGAALITGVTVDALKMESGRVVGIRSGEDEILADVVVVAEGTRALLLQRAGLQGQFEPRDVSLGIKVIIDLPANVLEERFQCSAGTGAAYTFVGQTGGIEGGGFLYTNRDTLSLGVVVKIDSLYKSKLQPHQVLEVFLAHPLVARLCEGGEVVEYSAQTVHRGGYGLASTLYGDGYVVVGSAARLLLNNIATLRGMDFAVVSGAQAAGAILRAREAGAYLADNLASYGTTLTETAIYREWETFKRLYSVLENDRLYSVYPDLVSRTMATMFHPSLEARSKLLASLRKEMKGRVSMLTLVKDLYQLSRGAVL